MTMNKKHPYLDHLETQHKKGTISRREFIRLAACLGVGAGVGLTMPGLVKPALASAPKRGGVLTVACQVMKISHPAQTSWIMPSNVQRQVLEYLTYFGADNIVKPLLAESWKASDDLKTWTFNLRKGVKFNNGDVFTSKDVQFTIDQWLTKDVKSSILGLMGAYLDKSGVELVNDYQIKLHLKKPEIAVPVHFFHYPAFILNHKTFEGDFLKAPHGTGPYTLEKYKEGEIGVVKARQDYWQKGADGKPLPYLDGMQFIDMGGDMAPQIAALKSGNVLFIDNGDSPGPAVMKAVKGDPNVTVRPVPTGTTRVLRMRVDKKPFDNEKVRLAIKLCQHREKTLALAYQNEGLQGQDVHVYPNHPEYCKIDTPKYDPAKAKKLLAEAGYPNGLEVELSVGSEWTDVVRYAEVLKQDAAPAGIKIKIKTMPTSQYWEKWTQVAFGITPWTHRPLGTMILNLAYVADDKGKPVAWNETRWVDEEFSKLLAQANGTVDVEERRKIFCKLETIQQQRGPIGIAYWMNTWMSSSKKLQGVEAHPNLYMLFNEAYLEG